MIQIEHLIKYYGSTCAVDDVSFTVSEGEIVGFLGPNGAGKSTTMNMMTGYLSATSGRMRVAGYDVQSEPLAAKRQIGYLPEQPPLYLDMTVDEYLGFYYDLRQCALNREAHLREVCDVARIGDVRTRLIRQLSKGYRQRVGIAGALVGNPRVIILDEPTVGLDPKQIIDIRNLIRGLGRDHTVILSTHILQEVQAVCDRIIIINKGRIVADEKTENLSRVISDARRYRVDVCGDQAQVLSVLRQAPGVAYAEALTRKEGDAVSYMVESAPGVDIRKKLFFLLAEKGMAMVGLETMGLSLEDIFINVVDHTNGAFSSGAGSRGRGGRAVRARGRVMEHQVADQWAERAQARRAEAEEDAPQIDRETDVAKGDGE